jgi:hypothetical protein
MAFELAVVAIKPAGVGTGIKASLKKIRGGQAKLSLTLSGDAFTKLAWSNGDKIVVQIGTGEHHGLIRLQKNNSTGQAEYRVKDAVRGGRYGVLALGHQPAFVDRGEAARWCQWEPIENGVIEIVLPKWADETGAKRRRPQAGLSPVPMSPRPASKVTSALMGDPEPGRSALDQKRVK